MPVFNHKVSATFYIGGLVVLVGAAVVFLSSRNGAVGTAPVGTTSSVTPSAATQKADTAVTLSNSNGYTGVEGDVMRRQSFVCEPRSEHEWYRTGRTFAVDPNNPRVMYISVEYKGVYKSTDGGATWKSSSKGIRAYATEGNPDKPCYSEYPVIIIDPKDSNHVVIGLSSGGGGHLHPSNVNQQVGGVYQSFNAGETWELMIDNTMNTYVNDVTFDADGNLYYGTASNPGSWMEADQNQLFVTKGLVYKTADKGSSWTELPTGIGSRTSATKVFVNHKNTKQLVVPTYSAARLSADGTGTGISTGKDTSVTQLGVLRSDNGGETWSKVALPDGASVISGAVSPTNFLNQYYISGSSSTGFVSVDGGLSFAPAQYMSIVAYDPFDATGKHMLAYSMQSMNGQGLHLHESFDAGLTWKAKGSLPSEILNLNATKTRVSNVFWHPTDKNTVYMNGASGYVWVSTNLGTSWKRILSYTDL